MTKICPLCNLPIPEGWELLSDIIIFNGEKVLVHPSCNKKLKEE